MGSSTLSIVIRKKDKNNLPMPIVFFFPSRNNEEFPRWMDARIKKAQQKVATMINFETNSGESEFTSDLNEKKNSLFTGNGIILETFQARKSHGVPAIHENQENS